MNRYLIIFAIVLLAGYFVFLGNSHHENSAGIKMILLDVVMSDRNNYDGKFVCIICYLNFSQECVSVSTSPSRSVWATNKNSGLMESRGTALLAKVSPAWDHKMPSDYHADKLAYADENLVVVEGFIIDRDTKARVISYEKAHFIEIKQLKSLK